VPDDLRIQEARLRSALGPAQGPGPIQAPGRLGEFPAVQAPVGPAQGPSFADTLKESIAEVNRLQTEASQAVQDLVTGKNRDVHSTVIAMQKADVSFKLMMEVRNKIVDAYKEVMRMQV